MKKITAILVAIMVVFALAACSENNSNTDPETSKPESGIKNRTRPGSGFFIMLLKNP